MHMREQYTLESVTNVLKNPTGTTALPSRFFCALTSHIDNLQILRHLIVTHWTHPDTMVTIDDYAHQVSPDNILYIDYLRNPPFNRKIDFYRSKTDLRQHSHLMMMIMPTFLLPHILLLGLVQWLCLEQWFSKQRTIFYVMNNN